MFIVVSAAAAGSWGRRRLLGLVPPAESCEERNSGREREERGESSYHFQRLA